MKFLGIAFTLMFVCALLTGCGTTQTPPPEIRTVEVTVPVRQPCVPATLDAAPEYPDTDSALRQAADAAERYLLMAAGRKLKNARLRELETVVTGCR